MIVPVANKLVTNPNNNGLFPGSASNPILLSPPDAMPAPPAPAIARPTMNILEDVAAAQISEPSRKSRKKHWNVQRKEEKVASLPQRGWRADVASG